MQREVRFLKNAELRATGGNRLEGYAACFNSPSLDLGGFTEQIRAGAFARAIRTGQDVRALFNHNPDAVLGRTKSGTLVLSEDSTGLAFRCDVPNSQLGSDVYESVRRGDIDGCSFSFRVPPGGDKWSGDLRTLTDVDLSDVGPVTYPAYPATSVGARSLWPDGEPHGVRSHRHGEATGGLYTLSRRSRIVVPELPEEALLETERRRARVRLAGLR
jgi:uncharacterized protein